MMDYRKSKTKSHPPITRSSLYVSTWKKVLAKLCFYTGLLGICTILVVTPYVFYQNSFKKSYQVVPHQHVRFVTDLKYILLWKNLLDDKPFLTGQTMFIKQRCKFMNCYFTYDKYLLHGDERNFDAVVFDVHDTRKYKNTLMNLHRLPFQKYIFRSIDPAEKYPVCNPVFDNLFNWTWTYKLDSDIPHPFMNIYDEGNNRVGPNINIDWIQKMKRSNRVHNKIKNKNKAVAWIVPSCLVKSLREDFVNDLANELHGYNFTIDVYGECAPKSCPGGELWKCYKMLEKDYFFHIVLEDYASEDYVTEGIVHTLNQNTIPIVKGVANYSRFLPPGSYLDAEEHGLKKLGAMIYYFINDPKSYSYLFDWKNHYYYTPKPRNEVCDLCAKLNDNTIPSNDIRVYKTLRKWWNSHYENFCSPESLQNTTIRKRH